MINVGIVGIGFMGMIHYLAYQKVRGAKVRAICSRDAAKRAGDWRGIKGNFGPEGTQMDLGGVAAYESLDAMMADPKIDLVDICLPPAMHATATVAALSASKHAVCEKPMALAVADADRMVDAARKAGKLLFVGHVLPFFPEYAFAYQAVRQRTYGELLGARFKRIISNPLWIKDFYDARRVGGPVIDLHVHDAHFIRLLCGMPRAVCSRGRMRGRVVEFLDTQFVFADHRPTITATSGVIDQQGRPFTHGFELHFERATLLYDFSVIAGQPALSMPLSILTSDGKVIRPRLGSADPVDAFVDELGEVSRAIAKGRASPLLGAELARDALRLCHAQTRSVRSGRHVKL